MTGEGEYRFVKEPRADYVDDEGDVVAEDAAEYVVTSKDEAWLQQQARLASEEIIEADVDDATDREQHPTYYEVHDTLLAGLARSRAGGYATFKVPVPGKPDMDAGEYLAVHGAHLMQQHELTSDEYRRLVDQLTYLEAVFAGEAVVSPKEPVVTEVSREPESPKQAVGDELEPEESGCSCDCPICDGGGGVHCHSERRGCYL